MSQDSMFVLAVAILTWGGVFFYLLRLDRLTRDVERQVNELNDETVRQVNQRDTEAQSVKEEVKG